MSDDTDEELLGFEDAYDDDDFEIKSVTSDCEPFQKRRASDSDEDRGEKMTNKKRAKTNKTSNKNNPTTMTQTNQVTVQPGPAGSTQRVDQSPGTSGTQSNNTETETKNKNIKTKQNKKGVEWKKNSIFTTFFIEPVDDKTPAGEFKSIHPMEIAKILQNVGVKQYKELTRAGRARYKMTFEKPQHAEDLINSKLLRDEFKYKVYVPKSFQESIGVVRNIPPSISTQEIQDKFESGNIKLTKVERIQKMLKNRLVETYSVKLYFAGDKLPDKVTIWGFPRHVEAYVFPVKQCSRCWRLGHKDKACKTNEQKCINCGFVHKPDECEKAENPECINCKGPYPSRHRDCPARTKQYKIQHLMANKKISFFEARKEVEGQTQTVPDLDQFPPLDPNNNNNNQQNSNNQTYAQQLTQNKQTKVLKDQPTQTSDTDFPSPQTQGSHNIDIVKLIDQHKTEIFKKLKIFTIAKSLNRMHNTLNDTDSIINTDTLMTELSTLINLLNTEMRSFFDPKNK